MGGTMPRQKVTNKCAIGQTERVGKAALAKTIGNAQISTAHFPFHCLAV